MREMQWYNEPPEWKADGDKLTVTAGAKTDFWRKTHYGFIRDNGHFYYQPVQGDFTLDVKVSGQYKTLYDQAGVMARVDNLNWVKAGIEFVEGVQQVSAVVTHEYSDWSVMPLPQNPPSIWLRMTRKAEAVELYYSLDGENYSMYRLLYLALDETVDVGLMCASPDGDGFTTVFENFDIRT